MVGTAPAGAFNPTTFTTNSDQMYIGHKVETGADQTSADIQWGDNDGSPRQDRTC
jgi:hypothetical protein